MRDDQMQENLQEYVNNSYDSIAIFILIVIIDKYRVSLAARLSPLFDQLLDR